MLQIWTNANIKNDYFLKYEQTADQLHRVQHNTMQSMSSLVTASNSNSNSNSNSLEPDRSQSIELQQFEPEREEKLDAINLRPTLRGYLSKNFIKGNDGTQITECSFIKMILRNERSLNQKFIAQIIWNFLLRTIDKR